MKRLLLLGWIASAGALAADFNSSASSITVDPTKLLKTELWTPELPKYNYEPNVIIQSHGTVYLTIKKDGFYVRGVKLKQDEKEAELVYIALRDWMRHQGIMLCPSGDSK